MPVFHEDGKFDEAELEEPEELGLELLEAELGLEPEPELELELELEPELALELDPEFEAELGPEPALALALEPELELALARSSLALFTGLRQSVKPARSNCSRRCITTNRLAGLGLAPGKDAAGGSESNCSPSSTPLSALAEDNALDKLFTRPGAKQSLVDFQTETVLELHRRKRTGGLTLPLLFNAINQMQFTDEVDSRGQAGLLWTNGDGGWLLCSDTDRLASAAGG